MLGSEIEGRSSTVHANVMHHATTPTVSSGAELEDPPGLYEKVCLHLSQFTFMSKSMYALYFLCNTRSQG